MRRMWAKVGILSFLLTFVLPVAASAHVEISPEEVQPGATRTFTVVVPTEKEIPTTGVGLRIPDGFEVVDVRSPSGGWRGTVEDGSLSWTGGEIGTEGIEFTSPEGEAVSMGESQEFIFEARTPQNQGHYAWPATQTYRDGSVVRWDGPEDAARPAAVVHVAASGQESTGPESAGHEDHGAGEDAAASSGGGISPYLLLGAGVLVATAATAGLAVLRGTNRA